MVIGWIRLQTWTRVIVYVYVYGKIIARDPSLVASRLYRMGVTRPPTRHVPLAGTLTACRCIIPLFRSRPPGLQPPVQGKERKGRKQSNKRSVYVLVRSNKSRYQSVPHRATFRRIRCTGKLHVQLQVGNPVPTPFVPGRDPRGEEEER